MNKMDVTRKASHRYNQIPLTPLRSIRKKPASHGCESGLDAQMTAKVHRALDQFKTDFIGSVSRELRTPWPAYLA